MKHIIKFTQIQKEKKKVESDVDDEENEKLKKKRKKKVESDSEEEQTSESKTINPLKMTFTFGKTENYDTWIKELEDIFKKITKDSSDLFVDVLEQYQKYKNALLNLIKIKYDGEKDIFIYRCSSLTARPTVRARLPTTRSCTESAGSGTEVPAAASSPCRAKTWSTFFRRNGKW